MADRGNDQQMELIAPVFVEEIGAVAWWRSFLAHESEVYYPPLQTSLLVSATRIYQDAARTADAALTSSEKLPEQESTPQDGAEGTAATATG